MVHSKWLLALATGADVKVNYKEFKKFKQTTNDVSLFSFLLSFLFVFLIVTLEVYLTPLPDGAPYLLVVSARIGNVKFEEVPYCITIQRYPPNPHIMQKHDLLTNL